MTQPALHTQFEGIAALRAALDQRQVSAVELAQSSLAAAEAASGLNAFLHIDAELTLAQARAADERRAAVRLASPVNRTRQPVDVARAH